MAFLGKEANEDMDVVNVEKGMGSEKVLGAIDCRFQWKKRLLKLKH